MIERLTEKKIGEAQNTSGTCSRAYWIVKGRPIASETSTMPSRPVSTASRTVATVQRGAAATV